MEESENVTPTTSASGTPDGAQRSARQIVVRRLWCPVFVLVWWFFVLVDFSIIAAARRRRAYLYFFRWCGCVELQHCIKSSMCSSHCTVQLCCLCRHIGSFYTVPLLTCLLSIYSIWKLNLIKPRIIINTATCIKRLFFTYRGFSESRPVFSSPIAAYFRRAFIWC